LKAENCDMKNVKKAIIQLYGVERSKWGQPRITSENIKKEIKYGKEQ